jgi:hypothetical protein
MKTKMLYLLAPLGVLAVTYLAWEPGTGPVERLKSDESVSASASTEQTPTGQAAPPQVPGTVAVAAVDQVQSSDCDVTTHYVSQGDGTVGELYSCGSETPTARHPYESYSNETLESLAYADAKAAAVLGMRLRDSNEARAMSLMLRAAALADGDTAPILQYFNAYAHPSAIDGVPVRKTIHTKFVLSAVADLLSDDSNMVAPWEEKIRRYSSDPETEIALLHERAREIVGQMRQIQLDVTGSSNIGGQGDA